LNREEILKKLIIIFRDILENEELILNENSSPENISEWDSLNHIYLVVEIEETFNKKFAASEIADWNTIKDILDSIQ
tara:strand:+ start:159 stop:389 length:231 start_codon:yes stop_codon:yes gene_type:complete